MQNDSHIFPKHHWACLGSFLEPLFELKKNRNCFQMGLGKCHKLAEQKLAKLKLQDVKQEKNMLLENYEKEKSKA